MNQVKMFEIVDRQVTWIKVMAIKLDPVNDDERYIIRNAGLHIPHEHVFLSPIRSSQIEYQSYKWATEDLRLSHQYIIDNWNNLESGSTIDFQYISGKTDKSCDSVRNQTKE